MRAEQQGDAGIEDGLRQLCDMVGEDELPDIVATYLHDSEANLAALERALRAGNVGAVTIAAHSLKSAAGLLGARTLAELCLQLETLGAAGHLTRARAVAARTRSEFENMRPRLEPYALVA